MARHKAALLLLAAGIGYTAVASAQGGNPMHPVRASYGHATLGVTDQAGETGSTMTATFIGRRQHGYSGDAMSLHFEAKRVTIEANPTEEDDTHSVDQLHIGISQGTVGVLGSRSNYWHKWEIGLRTERIEVNEDSDLEYAGYIATGYEHWWRGTLGLRGRVLYTTGALDREGGTDVRLQAFALANRYLSVALGYEQVNSLPVTDHMTTLDFVFLF